MWKRSFMDRSKIMIIGGILILIFDLVYNMLHKPISIGYLNRTVIAFGFCCILFGVAQEKIITLFRKIGRLFESRTYHVLFIILVISLLIRLLFLPERWINPDEGAHLYDAKFILDGKVPFVDYISRMPVYVYILAAFLKVFGCSYMAGRLLPLFSNIGIGILVFLIGNKLFNNKKIALLASAIYLFSPLSILWSVVVKTELPETLFVCIGMFLLLSYIKSEKEKYSIIFFSGVFFALAYYVRKSAIAILLASFLIVIYFYKDDIIKLFKTYSVMLLGYLSVVFIIILYFSSFMGFTATWQSALNPIEIVIDPILKITGMLSETTNSGSLGSVHQPYTQTISNWKSVLKLNSFLVIGVFLFFLILLHNFMGKKYNSMCEEKQTSFIFLSLWVITIFIFYIYYSIRTSFYTPYFGEVLPPLVLILAYGIIFFASEIRSHGRLKKNIGLVCIIVIALYISSISLVNTSFECVWSPETVGVVSEYIKLHSNENDVVLSGAMVWTLESNRKPFMNTSHPLAFLRGMTDDQIKEVEYQMEHNKPKFIVLDGYTEKIYLRRITKIHGAINESYILKKEVYGSMYPVKVYELR
jgi:4-amino-4-deoxy-L-arabinose transferase-like glycosyltransferase